MALIQLDHTPQTVKVCLPLYIILPDPGKNGRSALESAQSALPAARPQR